MDLHLKIQGERYPVRLLSDGPDRVLERDGEEVCRGRTAAAGADELVLEIDGSRRRFRYWRQGTVLHLQHEARTWRIELEDPDTEDLDVAPDTSPVLRAPMPGRILEVLCAPGDRVESGQALVRMEAMKMEIDVTAPASGEVEAIRVAAGDLVEPEAELVRIQADGQD